MSRSIVLDPRGERAANVPFELYKEVGMGAGAYVTSESWPDAEVEVASVRSAEGDRSRPGRPKLGSRQGTVGLYVIEGDEAAATNLCTNPKARGGGSGVLGTTGWVNSGLATFEAITLPFAETDEVYFDSVFHGIGNSSGDLARFDFNVTSGLAYRVRAWLWIATLGGATDIEAQMVDSGTTSATYTTVGSWVRIDMSRTATATGSAYFALRQTGAGAANYYWSAVLIRQTTETNAGVYFDGDSAGCAWTGAPHASTSTRLASGGARLAAIVEDLEEKLRKLRDEKGTFSRAISNARTIYDVESAKLPEGEHKGRLWRQGQQASSVELTYLPIGRGATTTQSAVAETTKPAVLPSYAAVIGGSEWARGDVKITDTQASGLPRRGLIAGWRRKNYSADADAALFYEAESRVLLGEAAIVADAACSGGNKVQTTLKSSVYESFLSTQAVSGSNHLEHVGNYQLWVLVSLSNSGGVNGDIYLRFDYGSPGLASYRRLGPVKVPGRRWGRRWVKMGLIRIERDRLGTHAWEGRFAGKCTSQSSLAYAVDAFALVPADEAYVERSAPLQVVTPSVYAGRDDFDSHGAGNLEGKTAPKGGVWAAVSGSDADPFTIDTTLKQAVRSTFSDSTAHVAALPSVNLAATVASVDLAHDWTSAQGGAYGLAARIGATISNMFSVQLEPSGSSATPYVYVNVEGTYSLNAYLPDYGFTSRMKTGETYRLQTAIDVDGAWGVWFGLAAAPTLKYLGGGIDSKLSSTGSIASGDAGIFDNNSPGVPWTRRYDNFWCGGATFDRVIGSGLSARWAYDGLWRETSGGDWARQPADSGDNLFLPPSSREKRSIDGIVIATQSDLGGINEGVIADTSVELSHTDRYTNVRRY